MNTEVRVRKLKTIINVSAKPDTWVTTAKVKYGNYYTLHIKIPITCCYANIT